MFFCNSNATRLLLEKGFFAESKKIIGNEELTMAPDTILSKMKINFLIV